MTDHYKFAFLNTENKVIHVAVFGDSNPETDLLEAIKDQLDAHDYKSCTIYGEAFIEGHFLNDRFIQMQPYESWILNEQSYEWEAPIPLPTNKGFFYFWDEQSINWVGVEVPQE